MGNGAIGRSFRLLGGSWRLLRADPSLLVLPVLSFLIIGAATAVIAGVAWSNGFGREREALTGLDYVLLGVYYFVSYFVGIFFNAAVVGAATIRLQGGDPTARDGLKMAASKTGKIAAWAAVSATVGLILRAISERAGWLGHLVAGLIGVAWSVVTYFVVPVILFEPLGVGASIKRSASIFKERWGETFVGAASIGLAVALVTIPLAMVAAGLAAVSVPIGIAVGVVLIGAMVAVGSALSGVYNATLYRYATTGETPGTFSPADLQASFRPKRGRRR
jgi:hypothetical protein